MSDMKQKRRKFSKEYKADIVELVLSGRTTVPEICRKHDLCDSMVYGWVKQGKIDQGQGPAGGLTTAEKEELSVLRRENRELKRERDFLVSAAAYFAKATKR